MGAGQSKPDTSEGVVLGETPIQFSQDVVNHLADASAGPTPTPERQSSIDTQIRSRIQAEILRLKQEEEEVLKQIETSLEKENLEHETHGHVGKEGEGGESLPSDSTATLNSTLLLGDVEEVRQKAEKYHQKREEEAQSPAAEAASVLLSCYKNNISTPLDCWKEVSTFRTSVAKMEKDFISSFR